jgi:phosphoribosylcarboxyaminoimidazole (NCAIR) mutase
VSTDFVDQAASILEQQGMPFVIISALAHDKTLRMYNFYDNNKEQNREKIIAELRDLADYLESKGDINER